MPNTRSQGNLENQQDDVSSDSSDGGQLSITNRNAAVVNTKMTIQERVTAFLGNFGIENRDSGKVLIFRPCSYSKESFEPWLSTQTKQFEGMDCPKEYTHAFLKSYVLFTAKQLGFKSNDLPVNMPYPLQEQIQAACIGNKAVNGDLWQSLAQSASKKIGSSVYFDSQSKKDTDYPQLLLALIGLVLEGLELLQKRAVAVQPLLSLHNKLVDTAEEIVSLNLSLIHISEPTRPY